MKKFERLLGILLVAAASAGLVAACGTNDENSCITDADCGGDQLCDFVDSTCAPSCEGDTDCASGEICVNRTDDPDSICIINPGCTQDTDCATGQTCNTQTSTCEDDTPDCTVDTDCDTAAGETCNTDTGVCEGAVDSCTDNTDCPGSGSVCNSDTGECETISGSTYFFAKIADVSDPSNQDLCVDPSDADPGSDIYGVSLTSTDENGDSQEYWALANSPDIKPSDEDGDTNAQTDAFGVLDGMPPANGQACPESFDDTTVVSLGCGGSVIVEFTDASGNRVEIQDGDTITVYEFGATCSSASSDQDSWQVDVCDATENEVINGTCNGFTAGSGQNTAGVTVSVP